LILTIDTFAWAELIRGSTLASRAREEMEQADLCLTPSIVMAEVASMCVRDRFDDRTIEGELESIRESSVIVPIDDSIAISGAHVVEELRANARARRVPLPGLADALVLATARKLHSGLLSGAAHFRDCPETVWLG
jgi:predicted nucleic acid-binding protein